MVEERVKRSFVKEILQKQGDEMLERQKGAMQYFGLVESGKLIGGISVSVNEGDFDGKLTETHLVYQRFLDMKRRKNQKKKRFPIHNRIVWANYESIAYKLMYYMTDDVVARIRSELHIEK